MPWHIRRIFYLIVCAATVCALSIIVLVRDTNLDTEILGTVGLVAGVANLLVALPANGNHGER